MERRMLKIAAFRIFRTQRFQPVFKGATIATEIRLEWKRLMSSAINIRIEGVGIASV